jgi:hypothetical protein
MVKEQFSWCGLNSRPGDCDDKWSLLPSNSYRMFPVGQLVDNTGTLTNDEGPNKNKHYTAAWT